MTQCQMIKEYIEVHGSITAKDAMNDLGVMRLAARIQDLEHQGYPITSSMENGINRFGEPTRYARYSKRASQ